MMGAYVREHFFGAHPELSEMVSDLTDEQISRLNRGGHDPYKVYAAYAAAVAHKGQPTVILAKTVKGYGLGLAGEAQNFTHSVKKLDTKALREFRDRFDIPINDEDLEAIPYYRPPEDSMELRYLKTCREKLGGAIPSRLNHFEALTIPDLEAFASVTQGSGDREISTTMAFVRLLSILVKDPHIGERIVPIVPDEARTFGMEGMFRQLGIYSSVGQLYEPVDTGQIMSYREDQHGQVMEEGINEGGAFAAWLAAATSYSNHAETLVPFYIYYSMFGFQRIGDLCWAAGDLKCSRIFVGRHLGANYAQWRGACSIKTVIVIYWLARCPIACLMIRPYAYELAVIIQHGLQVMFVEKQPLSIFISRSPTKTTYNPRCLRAVNQVFERECINLGLRKNRSALKSAFNCWVLAQYYWR
jgi:pyruvate dehydrogenase E1 component